VKFTPGEGGGVICDVTLGGEAYLAGTICLSVSLANHLDVSEPKAASVGHWVAFPWMMSG